MLFRSSITQSGVYYDIFTLPTRGQAGGLASGTEAYYSFNYANIHFICLDSHDSDRSTDGAMMQWLKADLAATRRRHFQRLDPQVFRSARLVQADGSGDKGSNHAVHGTARAGTATSAVVQSAWLSASPVRMRRTRSMSVTKILPSPTLPVFAAPTMASSTW